MSDRISWFGVPWWICALAVWGISLLLTIVGAQLAPSDLWTLPNTAEEKIPGQLSSYKHCDNCLLFNDGFYLDILRKDQCEAPHFVKTASCNIVTAAHIDLVGDKIPPPPDPKAGSICSIAVPPQSKGTCISGTVLEPQNTWSNFGYILAGILILFSRPRILGLSVGVNFCLIGITSWLYHATLKGWTQAFDVAWIYALLLSVLIYVTEAVYRRYKFEAPGSGEQPEFPRVLQWVLAGIPLASGIIVGVLKNAGHWSLDSTTATIVLIVALGVPILWVLFDWWLVMLRQVATNRYKPEWLGGRERILFAIFMVVPAVISFICRLSDGCGHPMCSPHFFIQAHAVWHFLGAVGLWWVYDFFSQAASEDNTMVKLGAFGR